MRKLRFAIGLSMAATLLVAQSQRSVTAIITAKARHSGDSITLKPADVTVTSKGLKLPVTEVTPLTGTDSEVFLAIDDTIDASLGSQLEELRHFLQDQPAATTIGVAYLARGSASIVQPPTADHTAAEKAIRLPNWKGGPSPYESIRDLIKHWPKSSPNARHEIVMISSGADSSENPEPYDPALDSAISEAQRSGIVIYTIYAPTSSNSVANSSKLGWSQGRLTRLAVETGGESYLAPSGGAVTFQPYLKNIATLLNNQYRITFQIKSGKNAELRDIKFSTDLPNTDVMSQRKTWIPAH